MIVETHVPDPGFTTDPAAADRSRSVEVMTAAVARAWEIARADDRVDAVPLAPAAASLDMFDSYSARGDAFAGAATALAGAQR